MVLESIRAMFESNLRCDSNRDWIESRFDFAHHCWLGVNIADQIDSYLFNTMSCLHGRNDSAQLKLASSTHSHCTTLSLWPSCSSDSRSSSSSHHRRRHSSPHK